MDWPGNFYDIAPVGLCSYAVCEAEEIQKILICDSTIFAASFLSSNIQCKKLASCLINSFGCHNIETIVSCIEKDDFCSV